LAHPKITMTLLVRNEQDIIAENIRFHHALGVDSFIVMDNLSTDATPDIIKELSREIDIDYLRQSQDDYNQWQWVTELARAAAVDHKADWVINNDADEFLKRRRDLRELVYNSETEKDQSIYRLELVELMLSYQLANEALGLLAFEKFKVPLAANSSRFKSLQGAAYTLAGQYKNAINTLSSVAIRSNRTAALFRAYALSKTGVYQEALKEFDASSALLGQLPAEMEAEFLTAAIEAALQIPNLNVAQQHLIMLRNVMVTDYQKANYWLLMAHFSRMNDETAEAILRFKAAVEFDVRPINAEALGYLSILEYQTGKITISGDRISQSI